ncbi:MAG: zinc dependent phospholipase C family protein [Chitinophagaceae bacterium]
MKYWLTYLFFFFSQQGFCWGFFAHQKINYQAVFLLPPQMMLFYKGNILFLSEHAVDPDMRRYALSEEGARHYIDLDHYGQYPYDSLPRGWNAAADKFGADALAKNGIVPWWIQTMQRRLVVAFKEKNRMAILKLSADIGHYISDAHVPLHASSNHNGQHTGQQGIHGFWESRIPELLAEAEWDFFIGKAVYLKSPGIFIWQRVLESAAAVDTVLQAERELTTKFPPDKKFAFENRNGKITRQYSAAFAREYDKKLKGMIERRMRQSIEAVASFWYTAWVDGGQPNLSTLTATPLSETELKEYQALQQAWRTAPIKGREH